MRPPEFTGGNSTLATTLNRLGPCGFNEAAGIHRRKLETLKNDKKSLQDASMRPPEFTGGNLQAVLAVHAVVPCFNEAAGIHRRKPTACSARSTATTWSFNEAAGIHRRKREWTGRRLYALQAASMRPPEFTGGNLLTIVALTPANKMLQ